MSDDLCPHGDKDWRCVICCLASLRRDHQRLTRAVRTRDKSGSDGPRPAFASKEPINLGALALLQDIAKTGGLDRIEAQLNTLRDPEPLRELQTKVRKYRSRCALVLKDALAPYPLTWAVYGPRTSPGGRPVLNSDGQQVDGWQDTPIPCPVVNEHGDCAAPLLVHRDNDPDSKHYGKAAVIRCKRDDDHEWQLAHGGWLTLGVLLGGTMGETG